MQFALQLAEKGRGHVEPNPLVGAVIVKDHQIVGQGWHQKYGEAHAEVHALSDAGNNAYGADLYVTLEPCCHQGKTPPCTDAVIQAGIRRVIIAMADPFPEVDGKGISLLQQNGIEVNVGIEVAQALHLNAPFLKLLQHKMPYVRLKWAMTLDGRIATHTGDSQWISNEASRREVHQIRGCADGILVGLGTALADDPLLTARPPGPRIATRIVLDSRGRIPLDCKLIQTANDFPTLIATTDAIANEKRLELEQLGCEVLILPTTQGKTCIRTLLQDLGQRRLTNLLVEGGAEVLGSFLDQKLADEVLVYVAPRLVGGANAPGPVGGLGVDQIADAFQITEWDWQNLEGDLRAQGRIDAENPDLH